MSYSGADFPPSYTERERTFDGWVVLVDEMALNKLYGQA